MNTRFGIHMGPRQVELVERVRRERLVEVALAETPVALMLCERGILSRRHFRGRCVYGPGPRLKLLP